MLHANATLTLYQNSYLVKGKTIISIENVEKRYIIIYWGFYLQNSIILYHSDYKKKIVEIILISPSVFDILGIPETNLRGRNTRTALSVRRSS